jgi:hypothetical protein
MGMSVGRAWGSRYSRAACYTRDVAPRWRRLGYVALALVALYPVALVIAGWAARGLVADTVRDRLAASLDGTTRVGEVDLALVRGQATLRDLAVERQHLGTLRLAIARIDVELAPLGAVIFDRTARRIAIDGAHLMISGGGALDLPKRRSPPIAVGGVVVTDSVLEIVATSALPQLGQVRITLDHVVCGPTRFRTALSWLFALESMAATVELPGDHDFTLSYRDRRFVVTGGPFGPDPVVLPVEVPRVAAEDEAAQLRALAFDLGTQLVAKRLKRWWWERLTRP